MWINYLKNIFWTLNTFKQNTKTICFVCPYPSEFPDIFPHPATCHPSMQFPLHLSRFPEESSLLHHPIFFSIHPSPLTSLVWEGCTTLCDYISLSYYFSCECGTSQHLNIFTRNITPSLLFMASSSWAKKIIRMKRIIFLKLKKNIYWILKWYI